MKAFKAFVKPFEASQKSVKIKLSQFLFQYNFLKCSGLEGLMGREIMLGPVFSKGNCLSLLVKEEKPLFWQQVNSLL